MWRVACGMASGMKGRAGNGLSGLEGRAGAAVQCIRPPGVTAAPLPAFVPNSIFRRGL